MADSRHQVNILIKARDEASRKLAGLAKTAVGIGAAFLSFRAIGSFVRSSTEAFLQQEVAANKLSNALALLNAQAQTEDMLKFAGQIQRMTIYGDEAVAEVMALGASLGKFSGDTLENATVAAIGLANAYRMDLQTAMTLIGKAAQGNTEVLARYGIVFKEGMSQQEKFNHLLEIGQQNFALASGQTKTLCGHLKQLANAWGDAKEQIGGMIASIPKLNQGITFARTVLENFKLSMDIVWTETALQLIRLWERIKHTFWSIGQLLMWLRDNWRQIFHTLWDFTKTVFSNMFDNIKNFFLAVWSWIQGEGFDFKWTGLMKGFEVTLQELPNVARRNIGPIEAALSQELMLLKGQFRDKLGLNLQPAQMGGLGGAAISMTSAAASSRGVAAVESRFMGGGASVIDYTRETANQNKRQTILLERIARAMERGRDTTVLRTAYIRETSYS